MYIQPSYSQKFFDAILSQNSIMHQNPLQSSQLQQRYLSPNFQESSVYNDPQFFTCNGNLTGKYSNNLTQNSNVSEGLIGGFITMTQKIMNSVEEFLFGSSSSDMNFIYPSGNEASGMSSQRLGGIGFYNDPFITSNNSNFLDSTSQSSQSFHSLFEIPLSFLTPFLGGNTLFKGVLDFGAGFVRSLTDIGSKALGGLKNLF